MLLWASSNSSYLQDAGITNRAAVWGPRKTNLNPCNSQIGKLAWTPLALCTYFRISTSALAHVALDTRAKKRWFNFKRLHMCNTSAMWRLMCTIRTEAMCLLQHHTLPINCCNFHAATSSTCSPTTCRRTPHVCRSLLRCPRSHRYSSHMHSGTHQPATKRS